jgi:hypothetical protein
MGDQLMDAAKAVRVAVGPVVLLPNEFFEQQKLEARIWHSKTVFSRTIIIAPNPATARGWSGCVVIDEAGHVKPLRELLEAMEPILSSDPTFRLWLAGTMANDDAHYSNELTLEPDGMTFQPDPAGHWYESQAGIPVHRVDARDAAAAGLKTFDIKTRSEITPEEARKKAIDREAWDLNYALKRKTGGTAAVALNLITNAMAAGRDSCLFGEDDFVPDWRRHLGKGKFAVGFDIATTENESSNPSSVAVLEMVGQFVFVRLLLAFKTDKPEVSKAMIKEAIDLGKDRRPRRLCIDATNERFFATELKKDFAGKVPTELVISSESTEHKGVKMLMKSYLGNILVNQFEDNLIALPEARYVREDFRLVLRDKGGFDNQTDSRGRHGDTFDAVKLALHGLLSRGGPAEAEAVGVGAGVGRPGGGGRWKNPFAKLFDNGGTKTNV